MKKLEAFRKMVDLVEENGGIFHQGNSRDTITFTGKDHKEVSKKVYEHCKRLDLNVYDLSHNDGWSDEFNNVKPHSRFGYR